ncbi:NusG domain II-containing protein [Virgibacillus sp. LDC1]|nr:NusG domain II-containing protein [Virgibacillus sp. LDC1]
MSRIRRGDKILFALILILGSFTGLQWWKHSHVVDYQQGQLQALITVNGKEYETVPLTGDERIIDIKTKFGHNTLKVYDYGIQMIYSDAPKRIALDMGFISEPYQQIICVPTRVVVEVLVPEHEQRETELDAVVG